MNEIKEKAIPQRMALAYGTRKIKVKLHERGFVVSRRRIGRIMKEPGLDYMYTVVQYKPHKTACNEAATENIQKYVTNRSAQTSTAGFQ